MNMTIRHWMQHSLQKLKFNIVNFYLQKEFISELKKKFGKIVIKTYKRKYYKRNLEN